MIPNRPLEVLLVVSVKQTVELAIFGTARTFLFLYFYPLCILLDVLS
jgi:hypothetical protein